MEIILGRLCKGKRDSDMNVRYEAVWYRLSEKIRSSLYFEPT